MRLNTYLAWVRSLATIALKGGENPCISPGRSSDAQTEESPCTQSCAVCERMIDNEV
jgi:hypothetical protein